MKKITFLILGFILCFSSIGAQNIYTIAGDGNEGFSGDGLPAISNYCEFYTPEGLFVDKVGNVYISDESNNVVRKINTLGIISTFAGNHSLGAGYSGDGGQATAAQLNAPVGICGDTSGNIYIAEYGNNVIRKVNAVGIISTVAGTGIHGYSGDGGLATLAQLYAPLFVSVDIHGNIFIPDLGNHRIREVNASGIISTVAGNGMYGYSGDGGPAIAAELSSATAACADSIGNIYIVDESNARIRKVNTSGIISTIAGNGQNSFNGDGGLADSSELNYPTDIHIDHSGNIFITDSYNQRIRKIDTSGIMLTVVGNGKLGDSGNGGPATNAELNFPTGMYMDVSGNIYFSDQSNEIIREVVYKGTPLGVNAIENDEIINIYPNPNNGNFTLKVTGIESDMKYLEVYNVLGDKVFSNTLPSNHTSNMIDLDSQPNGVYLYRVIAENGNLLGEGKIVIQK